MTQNALEQFRSKWTPGTAVGKHAGAQASERVVAVPITLSTRYRPAIVERDLRGALRLQHEWHLSQTEPDQHGVIPAEAYAESRLCASTLNALAHADIPWTPVSPSLLSDVKTLQYALAYNADASALVPDIASTLDRVRKALAACLPVGSDVPVAKLKALAAGLGKLIADETDPAKAALIAQAASLIEDTINPQPPQSS